jgi:tetratricopeptide (TPR) repeat protein
MKKLTHIVLLLLFFTVKLFASAPAGSLLDSANAAYEKSDYEKAAGLYEEIGKMGYEAPEVYYNLGNAYFKLDRIGLSVLNYERAKKLAPYDEDLNFNLKMANQRTLDKIEPLPKLFLEEWWEKLTGMQSEQTWALRSIVAFLLFFFFLGVFITSNKVFTKQLGFWLSILFFAFSLFSFFVSKSSYSNLSNHTTAVILSTSVEVKNAPTDAGKKLFLLHEGTKVAAPDTSGGWVKIELSSDKVGWVKRSSLEFI